MVEKSNFERYNAQRIYLMDGANECYACVMVAYKCLQIIDS